MVDYVEIAIAIAEERIKNETDMQVSETDWNDFKYDLIGDELDNNIMMI